MWVNREIIKGNLHTRNHGGALLEILILPIILILASAAAQRLSAETPGQKFEARTTAFRPGGDVPKKFTCDGSDVSPALTWSDPPAGTVSFALIADDPDAPAGTWVHWVAFDLPGSNRQLAESVPKIENLAGGGRQGVNDSGSIGYEGPCPPPGKPHRYFFKLYALDTKLRLKTAATKQAVERAMEGHVLAEAQLVGRYKRP